MRHCVISFGYIMRHCVIGLVYIMTYETLCDSFSLHYDL